MHKKDLEQTYLKFRQ